MQKLVWTIALALSALLWGCQCQQSISSSQGEVAYVMDQAGMPAVASAGVYEFPATAMGASSMLNVVVRNLGRGTLTLESATFAEGDGVKVGAQGPAEAPFALDFTQLDVRPTEDVQLAARFSPPVTNDRSKQYEVKLRVVAANAGSDTAITDLTLRGLASSSECEVPTLIDFGAVAIGSREQRSYPFGNPSAKVSHGDVGGIQGDAAFTLDPMTPQGGYDLEPFAEATLGVHFAPREAREYSGTIVVRRSQTCPVVTVRLRGAGVASCLTWTVEPADGMDTTRANFGFLVPGRSKPGTVRFSNVCGAALTLNPLMTTDPVFAISRADPMVLDRLTVPAGMRADVAFTAGTAELGLEFRPTANGAKTGELRATVSNGTMVRVPLRGGGGGPDIDVRPAMGLNFGRVPYFANTTPAPYAERRLTIANVGVRPPPPDTTANLYLGLTDGGTATWTVRGVAGSNPAELCVGEWDTTNQRCTNAPRTSVGGYDPNLGIEAVASAALIVPVRLTPTSVGMKQWEIVIHSNDFDEADVVVPVRADVQVLPPCNFDVTPTTLDFGLVSANQTRELSARVRNLGTAPTELCYFSGFELAQGTDPAFSLPSTNVDPLELGPGAEAFVKVRSATTAQMGAVSTLRGELRFNVSSPTTPVQVVQLRATAAPGCLSVTPSELDFGRTEQDCFSPERYVTIYNTCAQAVTINALRMPAASVVPNGTGSCTQSGGCPEFVLTTVPTNLVGPLLPGASRTIGLKYRPYDLGADTGSLALNVTQAGAAVDYVVPLRGQGDVPESMGVCGLGAVCPAPQTTGPNATVTLTPSAMSGSGGVNCQWTVLSRPATANGAFGSPNSCTSTTYFADVVGTHTLRFTVTDARGRMTSCDTTVTVLPRGDFWVELTWDRNNDMDLHLLHPNAGPNNVPASWARAPWDCYFSNLTPSWDNGGTADDPSLDRDDITGRGPENMRINTPSTAHPYTIGVRMYSWTASPNPVTSTVKIYCGGQLVATEVRTLAQLKAMWIVGTVSYSGSSSAPCTFTQSGQVINVP